MFLLKVIFKGIVVDVVLLLAVARPSIANVTPFMPVTTMSIQFVVSIEPLAAKATFRMSFETTLIDSPGNVIAVFFMSSQFCVGEELMLMRKHFFIPRAEITHSLSMLSFDMSMKVRPS